jgi:peroxiredoxin
LKTLRFSLLATALLCSRWGLAVASVDVSSTENSVVRVGDMAPDFTLRSFGGKDVHLSDHFGETPVLVIFWSFFCFPCQKEIPQIEELYRELTSARLAIIGVCLDGPEYDTRVLPFVEEKGITFPNAYDRQSQHFYEIAERYGVIGTPTSFLLDAHGRIRSIHLGRLDLAVLKSLVKNAAEHSFCAEITKPAAPEQR